MTPHQLDIAADLLVPLVVALIFQFLSWSWMRTVRGGRPLTPVMKGMLRYGFLGALGMGYIFGFGSIPGWPIHLWYVITFVWFALLGLIAYWRHRRKTAAPTQG